jgi:Skp family chaperone for outer membrane proteins
MNVRYSLVGGLAAGVLLSSAALAQAPAPAPPPVAQGPMIPGFCTFSQAQVLGASKVGQAVMTRMKMLVQDVNAELQPEADQITAEKRTLDSQGGTMDQATLQARGANWQLRYANFQKKAQQRNQELEETKSKELGVVWKTAQPILLGLYQQNHCSVLLDRDQGGVAEVNPAMDLSGAAVTQLDVRLQTLTFDRVHLDTTATGGAPAPQR